MKKLLTDKSVMALKPARAGRRYIIGDVAVPGLGVRVTAHGHRTYILGARFPGSRHFVRRELGEVGVITLAAAREQARTWLVSIKSGVDPTQQRATVELNNTTFSHVAESFIQRHLLAQRKGHRVAREIRNELIKHWGDVPIKNVTRQMVVERIEAIVDRPAPRHAHTVYAHVRALYNWAIARGVYDLETSPCDRLRPIAFIGVKRVRERVLTDDELVRLWAATDHYPYGHLTRLLLLCGARLNECARATWSEVDFVRRTLTVPAERFKANSVHVIPLSDDAMALLQSLPRRGDFIFTSSGARPVGDFFAAKRRLDSAMGIAPWQFHDLRRTFRTRLAELKVPDTVAELAIGHAKRGLRRVYDQHTYADEIRAAMEAWAARLRSIVAPEPETNVIRRASFRH
jgi:integrase